MNDLSELKLDPAGKKIVTIQVNENSVELEGHRVTGLQIKQAAIAQGVDIQLDFVLSEVLGEGGKKTKIVGDQDHVSIHEGSRFFAVPHDDNSDSDKSNLSGAVLRAIEQLKETFPDSYVTYRADESGGAYVIVDPVPLSEIYQQEETWIGARITFQYPYCDIYPLFVRGDLVRRAGTSLGEALSCGHQFEGRSAVQVSRRSNRWSPTVDTAALKFLKVLEWLRGRP